MMRDKINKTLRQAIKYYKRGNYFDAIKKFHWVLERDKNNTTAKHFLTLMSIDDEISEDPLLETIKHDPDNLSAYRKLEKIYWNRPEKINECKQVLQKIVNLEKDEIKQETDKANLALVLEKLNELDDAMKLYKELSSQNPDFHHNYWRMGHILIRKGETKQAIKMFSTALEKAKKFQEDDPECIDQEVIDDIEEGIRKAQLRIQKSEEK